MTPSSPQPARPAGGLPRPLPASPPRPRRRLAAALALLALPLGACRSLLPRAATQPIIPSGNAALIHYISRQPYVTAAAAYRSIYVLWKNELFAGDFPALCEALREGGIIGRNWNPAPDQYLDRASVGFMVCRTCGIRSGLNWQLTGLGRYAWRELQYKRIAGPGSELSLIGGGEYLGVLARAEDYLRKSGRQKVERAELGAAP